LIYSPIRGAVIYNPIKLQTYALEHEVKPRLINQQVDLTPVKEKPMGIQNFCPAKDAQPIGAYAFR